MLSKQDNLETKAKLMIDSWLHKCDEYKVVVTWDMSGRLIEQDHLLQPPGLYVDSYEKLTDKVFRTFMYVYERYPDFDWYVKADDDTYMIVENLRWFLSQNNPSEPMTFGF